MITSSTFKKCFEIFDKQYPIIIKQYELLHNLGIQNTYQIFSRTRIGLANGSYRTGISVVGYIDTRENSHDRIFSVHYETLRDAIDNRHFAFCGIMQSEISLLRPSSVPIDLKQICPTPNAFLKVKNP